MAYTNHKFCWHGVISTDVDKAKTFYPEVLGWSVQTVPMGDDTVTMFAPADGIPRAHLGAPAMPGMPSHWENYLRVEDVDRATRGAIENGGKALVAPMDIPPGRFSVVTSPSGAALSLFHEADPSSEDAPAGAGGVHWVELQSLDLDADVAWMKATFGLTTETMPLPQGGTYFIFKDGETVLGGAMAPGRPGAPSMWVTWVRVDDVDGTLERTGRQGGSALTEVAEMPGVGRMAMVQDTTGGVFGVITPS